MRARHFWTGMAAITIAVAIGSVAAISRRSEALRPDGAPVGGHGPRYGLSSVGLSYPFAAAIAKGFADAAARAGAQAVVLDAKGGVAKQANDIDDLIAQHVAGVAIMPLDSVVAQGWVDRLSRGGVPVVAVGALVGDPARRSARDVYPRLTALIAQDEVEAGRAAGHLAARLLPQGKPARIAIIEGAAGFPEVRQRAQGFVQGMGEAGRDYRLIASQPGNWTPEGGEAACQNMLAAHPDIDLIFNEADDMVVGCARAVRAAGAKAKLVGMGGSRLALASIRASAVDGTVCFSPEALGALAFAALRHPPAREARFITAPFVAATRTNITQCSGQW